MWFLESLMDADAGGASGGAAATTGGDAAGTGAAASGGATVTVTDGAGDGKAADGGDAKGFWDPKWRERLAGSDEKALAQLARYASPEAVWQKTRALEQRMSSGELKPTLTKNAKPEEVAAYRQAHGIPEKADGYDFKDVKLDDSDKPFISKVAEAAHGVNVAPDQLKAIVGVWPALKAEMLAAQTAKDAETARSSEDTLRSEWGPEFRRNMGLIHQLLDSTGSQDMKDKILSGHLADGTPIGSSPEALKVLLGVALKDNPAGVVVPSGGADPVGTINDEIAKIEEKMRTDRKGYDKDEKIQARYRDLLLARSAQQSRRAA